MSNIFPTPGPYPPGPLTDEDGTPTRFHAHNDPEFPTAPDGTSIDGPAQIAQQPVRNEDWSY